MFALSEQTIQFLLNNGVAVVVVIALLYGFYLVGKAIAAASQHVFETVVIPMKTSAIAHLENINTYLSKTTDAIEAVKCTLEKTEKTVELLQTSLQITHESVRAVKDAVSQLETKRPDEGQSRGNQGA